MALKQKTATEGFVIDSPEAARKALELRRDLKEGIADELEQIEQLGRDVASWMKNNHVNQIEIDGGHGTLVQRTNPSKWDRALLLKALKKAAPQGWKTTWGLLSTRQPDPDKIQQAIKDGDVELSEIESAYVQGSPQKPFVQVYKDE